MTVNTETYKHVYPTNGTEDTFNFSFEIQHKNQLSVELISSSGVSTSKSLDIDYIVTGTGNTLNKTNYTSGSIVFYDVPADDQSVLITLSVPATQINRFVEGSVFPSKTIEESLDKLTLKIKQLQEEVSRCVKVSDVLSDSTEFSFPVGTPYYYIRYNSSGTGFDAVEGNPKDDIIVELDPDPHLGNHLNTNGFEIVGNSVILNPTNEVQLKSDDVGIQSNVYLLTDNTAYWNLTSTTQTWYISSNSIIDLTINGLRIGGSGVRASTISNDNTLAANSATTLVTQSAVKGFGENTFIALASPIMTGNFDTNGYSFVTTSGNKSMTFDCHGSGSITFTTDNGGVINLTSANTISITGSDVDLVTDTVYIGQDLVHKGDTNTKISVTADAWDIQTGGSSRLDISNSGVRLGATGARITAISTDGTLSSNSDTLVPTEKAVKTYVAVAATQAEMEAKTSTSSYVSPGRMVYHEGVPKIVSNYNLSTNTITGYGISAVVETINGGFIDCMFSFTTSFSSTGYTVLALAGNAVIAEVAGTRAVNEVELRVPNTFTNINVLIYGDV